MRETLPEVHEEISDVLRTAGLGDWAFDDAAKTCTIEGRGIDGRGASRALASGTVIAQTAGACVYLAVIARGARRANHRH